MSTCNHRLDLESQGSWPTLYAHPKTNFQGSGVNGPLFLQLITRKYRIIKFTTQIHAKKDKGRIYLSY